jgi:hypothetical protein
MPQIIRVAGSGMIAVCILVSPQWRAIASTESIRQIQGSSGAPTLDIGAIEEAIDWGLGKFPDRGIPEPYVLAPYSGRLPPSTLGSIGGRPVQQRAIVLTPFVRVALAAHAAAEIHAGFTQQDVTADMIDPLLWVAAFAYDSFPYSSRPTADRLFDIREIVVADRSGPDRNFDLIQMRPDRVIAPAWSEPRLDRIGEALKIKVTARGALAAFPRQALSAGRDLVVMFRQHAYVPSEAATVPNYTGMRIAIRQSDVASWR